MIRVAILNGTSYTALELMRLLAQHPEFVVTSVTARSGAGKMLGEVFPQLYAMSGAAVDPELVLTEEVGEAELAFVCLPHAAAAEAVVPLLKRGLRVVDLSADFRLRDPELYAKWYKHTHPAPELLESAVFGLPERYRAQIREAQLVANPGCHVTAALLGLLPVVEAGLIEPGIIVDSKTGISGAGRGLKVESLYAEANEDVAAYSLSGHRHMPEIAQELEQAGQRSWKPRLTFLPHLIPMTRGILASCYAELKQSGMTNADILALYQRYYQGDPFVHVMKQTPHTKWTTGSNHVFVHPMIDQHSGQLVALASIDNLVKGASGQALQNANIMFGLPETSGLAQAGVTP